MTDKWLRPSEFMQMQGGNGHPDEWLDNGECNQKVLKPNGTLVQDFLQKTASFVLLLNTIYFSTGFVVHFTTLIYSFEMGKGILVCKCIVL